MDVFKTRIIKTLCIRFCFNVHILYSCINAERRIVNTTVALVDETCMHLYTFLLVVHDVSVCLKQTMRINRSTARSSV